MLKRELGTFNAVMLGLGSILGTGVFVSIGIAAGITGPSVVLAIVAAGLLAVCNALSSAQLAASHPTSGGTYEYGYVYLSPSVGFSAGWLFLCAKSASATAAAMGFSIYTLSFIGISYPKIIPIGSGLTVIVLCALVLSGIRRSSLVNTVIVSITIFSLLFFIVSGLPSALKNCSENMLPFFQAGAGLSESKAGNFLEATALMFVAYTGYGRIATLGEEVKNPRTTIPIAITLTLLISLLLYLAVGFVGVAATGSSSLAVINQIQEAPLVTAAEQLNTAGARFVLSIGAMTAMLGVLLNLILGLSRVVLAMGRRGDLPKVFAELDPESTTPVAAVLVVGCIMLLLIVVGDLKFAWSLSACTVLLYYGITNLAAIKLPQEKRLYPLAIAWIGLLGCLGLAFWVEPKAWLSALVVLAVGIALRTSNQNKISG